MFTPWGYEVDNLPPIMTEEEFNTATGNTHAGDARLGIALDAASAALRNECGWHITPSLDCKATLSANGKVASLPAALVTEIKSVTEDGEELRAGQFEARQDGLIRRCQFRNWSRKWGGVVVEYTAGYDDLPDLKAAAMHLAEAALSIPTGVASESAGGVSISYATQAATVTTSMVGGMSSALAPYKVVRAHAT